MYNDQHLETPMTTSHEDLLCSKSTSTTAIDTQADQTHQLQIWFDLPTAREQRRYLECHCNLLNEQSETILSNLSAQEPENAARTRQRHEALMLLQDARKRGGTEEAVREAYVNLHGGFVLDLPPWLEAVEQRLTELRNQNRSEETAEIRVELLQEALKRVQEDVSSALELVATLQRELADSWYRHPRTDHAQALETAIHFCEKVLRIFIVTCYPYQYAKTQKSLGTIYRNRIIGERRENLEQAIICFHEALRVLTLDTFPFEYARIQNNLGNVYWQRIAGERRENLEQAIACFHKALHVWTLDAHPFDYVATQNNLGIAYQERIAGERRENLERTLACYQEALRVWTLDAHPYYYAIGQNNLGIAYQERIAGERRENLEQAISCQHEALHFWTFDAFPLDYARAQNDLGHTYRQRLAEERSENLGQAITCFHEALRVYTMEASPREARNVHVSLAETQSQCSNWNAVLDAYTTALKAEDLLIILGTGTLGRDAILKEGRDAPIRLGYALHRLGHITEAAVAIERGRARGLAEAMAFDAADPTLITNEERRSRYMTAREELIRVQADLHTPLSQDLDENTRRQLDLERTATYRHTKSAFDALVAEIREADDPAEFLNDTLDATTMLRAATQVGSGHALVYLVATPWGGSAVAAFSEQGSSSARFASLDIPNLTEAFVNTLIETRLQDSSEKLLGGFALAQMGEGFEQMCQQWEGETFQAKANALHERCHDTQQDSALDDAAQAAMTCPPFASLAQQSFAVLNDEDQHLLAATFDAFFLQQELTRCLEQLGTTILSPMMDWLQEQGATSLTLIPCGQLAAFPLTAVLLPDGRSVGETLPTSVAPSARSLLQTATTRSPQAGMATLGDPHDNLPWSEAEALTLTALAQRSALPAEVHLKQQATRERLLSALGSRWIVNACCHGTFDTQDFLQSSLRLAHDERITMAEMLNHSADLRGLRLLLLSACQTALLDLQGAHDEGHSLAVAMVQAGAQAVLAAQWAVDDKATYLLMVRFLQEWLPTMEHEPPAAALARAQAWLRRVTNQELALWHSTIPTSARVKPWLQSISKRRQVEQTTTREPATRWEQMPVRGRSARYTASDAQLIVRIGAERDEPSDQPYADPYYWAGFQVIGW